MITKILFTALVIVAAMVFMRHKNGANPQRRQSAEQLQDAAHRRNAMLMAVGLVALTLAISAGIYYWHWQDEHRIAIVRVINTHSGTEQSYHVYHNDLHERSFRTVEGTMISLSDAERMEVQENAAQPRP
ncbi:MAG: hypothetical protein OQL05_02200 [Gammaproteobacteria bacterium]|nr:hypothetical protein [Gammaproteobacteria bacterium]MCW8972075.1 hypothetical protein [Gammaproteobacteria bacterium]MCW8993588.1 hypothetical protein [Gammaproteobacteria bacterium]